MTPITCLSAIAQHRMADIPTIKDTILIERTHHGHKNKIRTATAGMTC